MKSKFFVFDTNTLLSALFNENSVPAMALKKAILTGTLLISEEVADEYLRVFSKPKFDKYVPLPLRYAFIENIISNSLPVIVKADIKECRDPFDDKFLSLAISGDAQCIITGDSDLLVMHPFRGVQILNPNDFLNNF